MQISTLKRHKQGVYEGLLNFYTQGRTKLSARTLSKKAIFSQLPEALELQKYLIHRASTIILTVFLLQHKVSTGTQSKQKQQYVDCDLLK